MAFVPFTIIFMVCLMGLHGSALPHCSNIKWPTECANQEHCTRKPKDFPTTEEFKQMQGYSNFDFSFVNIPQTTDRTGSNICRRFRERGPIYLIRDANNAVRFVVQDPKLFQFHADIGGCKEQIDLPFALNSLTCQQYDTEFQLPVTTCDGRGLELLKVSIPTGCLPVASK